MGIFDVMKVQIHLFAAARDAAGRSPVEVVISDDTSVADLRAALVQSIPELKPLQASLLVAVNNQYAADDLLLKTNDEVACFPPVSGG